MADQEHLSILMQGEETWNRWRKENEGVRVDLRKADLKQANLNGADLTEAHLTGADLRGANHVLIGLVMKGWINAFGRDGEPEFIPQPAMALRF